MSTKPTLPPLAPLARPTGICIIRSEPIDGKRYYSITAAMDVLKPTARRPQSAGGLDEALDIVARLLREMDQ